MVTIIHLLTRLFIMAAQIKRFQPKDKQQTQERLEQLQLFLDQFPELKAKDVSSLVWKIKKENKLNDPDNWTFIMISPEQNLNVVQWLTANSKRPLKALELWALLFDNVHRETGQIMLTRQELADKVKISSSHITNVMSELESIKAITKQKEGRGVTYYMNPHVGTHLNQEDRNKARIKAPSLKVISGGK